MASDNNSVSPSFFYCPGIKDDDFLTIDNLEISRLEFGKLIFHFQKSKYSFKCFNLKK